MARSWQKTLHRLEACGVSGRLAAPAELRAVSQSWLERYCRNVEKSTGQWVYRGHRWHAYSYGFEHALAGDAARRAYAERRCTSFLVYFESHDELLAASGPPSPALDWADDVYVFPADLEWTMVFTHERESGFGPYFALGAY